MDHVPPYNDMVVRYLQVSGQELSEIVEGALKKRQTTVQSISSYDFNQMINSTYKAMIWVLEDYLPDMQLNYLQTAPIF